MVKSKPSMTASARIESFTDFEARHMGDAGRYQLDKGRARELTEQGLNGKNAFQQYIDDNGIYGTATVLEDAEFDAYAKANKLEVFYRGMPDGEKLTGVEKHENFMYDDRYYVGNGMFGDGQYFGDLETAEGYAVSGDSEGSGAVIKAALKPGARVVRYDDIHADIVGEYPMYKHSEWAVSVYARSKGYDAIDVGAFKLVINRDAIVVSSDIRRIRNYDYI